MVDSADGFDNLLQIKEQQNEDILKAIDKLLMEHYLPYIDETDRL